MVSMVCVVIFKPYKDNNFPVNKSFSLKGRTFVDTGFVFAPYIPLPLPLTDSNGNPIYYGPDGRRMRNKGRVQPKVIYVVQAINNED